MTDSIAIMGAGITGITAARALSRAGHKVVVIDKGRGIGGRLATRRVGDSFAFDHGAQYISARGEAFADVLAGAEAAGAVAPWAGAGSSGTAYVGTPGMNALVKYMAEGLDVRLGTEVTPIRRTDTGWVLDLPEGASLETARLVCTVPPPQARALLGHVPEVEAALAPVVMQPCWTLMAAFDAPLALPVPASRPTPVSTPAPAAPTLKPTLKPADGPLGWVARNSTKPGRPEGECWVAQATPAWSEAHLEAQREEVMPLLIRAMADALGISLPSPAHAAAHRWRYAMAASPLGTPSLTFADGTLHLGGDWCLGARVEHGFDSGQAIARAVSGQA